MNRGRLLTSVFCLLISAGAVGQAPPAYSRVKLDTLYESWVNSETGQPVNNVISLNPGNFRDQTLANPHVQYTDGNPDWLLMCYGDQALSDHTLFDAIYVVRRQASNGAFQIPQSPVLAHPPNAGPYAYLGAGAGITKTKVATSAGRKYFAVVPVGSPTTGQAWITWAASTDGTTWKFMTPSGAETADPNQSVKLIRRQDYGNNWQHVAMVYLKTTTSDPGFFYVHLGYSGGCGIKGTWWRLPFVQSHPWGLKSLNPSLGKFEAQRFDKSLATPAYLFTDSCATETGVCVPLNDAWQCNAQDPPSTPQNGNTGAADIMDLIAFEKEDGTLDHVLSIYTPEARFGQQPTPIYYVKGSPPATSNSNFQWQPHRLLDTSMFWDRSAFPQFSGTYSSCGAGGGYFLSANYSGTLFGFASTWRSDQRALYQSPGRPCGFSCGWQVQGLLPFAFKLQNLGVDSVSPKSGPRSGGTLVTLSGSGFASGAAVDLGGSPVAGPFVQPNSIIGTTTAHAAGVAFARVANSSGESDLRANAFVYDYDDVPANHPYHDDVVKITRNRVKRGVRRITFARIAR
jgi:hypothetical protein